MLVSDADDPAGPYEVHGPLYTGDDPALRSGNRWSIDFTVLQRGGRLFGLWSGWDGADDDNQCLYIAPMSDPVTVSGPRVRLAGNDDFAWELTGARW